MVNFKKWTCSLKPTFWKLYTFNMDLSGWEARMKPPCVSFDWKTAVECVLAFVCLKEDKIPPVCMSCMAIKPGPAFVAVGDVAQSMVSCKSMAVVVKNRYHVVLSCVARAHCRPGSRTFSQNLSTTPVIVSFLPVLPSQPCPQVSTKSSVFERMLRRSKVCLLYHCRTLLMGSRDSPQSLQEEGIGDSSWQATSWSNTGPESNFRRPIPQGILHLCDVLFHSPISKG